MIKFLRHSLITYILFFLLSRARGTWNERFTVVAWTDYNLRRMTAVARRRCGSDVLVLVSVIQDKTDGTHVHRDGQTVIQDVQLACLSVYVRLQTAIYRDRLRDASLRRPITTFSFIVTLSQRAGIWGKC